MSAPSPVLTGGCNCGAVRFAIDAPLVVAAYCHCTRCQRRSGAASQASARVSPGSFRFLRGDDVLGRWAPGDGLDKVFCSRCGSAISANAPGTDDVTVVRLGAIDGDPGIRPSARQFVAYAAPWEPLPDDGLPRFAERMPSPEIPAAPAAPQ